MKNKEYHFLDTEIPKMLDQLLKLNIIELSEMKWPEETGKVNDPNYCKYHHLVNHPTQCCFVLKERILGLISQGKITLEEEKEVATTNQTAIVFGSFDPILLRKETQKPERLIPMSSRSEIQFGMIDLVDLSSHVLSTLPFINGGSDDNVIESASLDDEG